MIKNFKKINLSNLLLGFLLLILLQLFQVYRNWSEENKSPYNQIVKKCVGKKSKWRKIVKFAPSTARSNLIMCFDKEFEKLREERITKCIENTNDSKEECSKIFDAAIILRESYYLKENKLQ